MEPFEDNFDVVGINYLIDNYVSNQIAKDTVPWMDKLTNIFSISINPSGRDIFEKKVS